ncbi:hypothetical protein AB0392_30135 [Nonomuraea angiospora]
MAGKVSVSVTAGFTEPAAREVPAIVGGYPVTDEAAFRRPPCMVA